MALVDRLPERAEIALDADAIIYYVEEHEQFLSVVEPLFDWIAEGRATAHVSVITLMEVLDLPFRENRVELANQYRDILINSRNFRIHDLTLNVAERAAAIRAERGLKTPDAIVAATAIEAGCTHLVTNNEADFARLSELSVLVIREFATN